MRRTKRIVRAAVGPAVVMALVAVGLLLASTESQGASSLFLDTFDGNPGATQPWQPANWGVDANESDMWNGTGQTMDSMAAHHGPDCSPPMATHQISTLDQAVFQCRDHIMTSVAGGYAAAYLTPPAMMDLRAGEAVLRFDMSTLRGSGRDWVDVWITPFGDQVALPLNLWLPPYNGEPNRAIQLKMEGESRFEAYQYTSTRRSSAAQLPTADFAPYEDWLTPSATTRSTFELRLSRTRVSFCMPAFGRCWVNTNLAVPLDWDRGVVQLAHHSYNAVKDCAASDCVNSWHWDNVRVEPALPMEIVPPAPRWAVATSTGTTITLQRPAPANAMVRFAAVGTISVSFDGGRSYAPAVRRSLDRRSPEHFSSYLQAIPEGTTSITFQGSADQFVSRWMVANLNVVAQGGQLPAPGIPGGPPDEGGGAGVPPSGEATTLPARLLDTRGGPRPAPGDIVAVPVRAHPAVPDDATAAIINLTGTEAAADGYVTAYPCGQAPPLASNLNLTSGATTANLVITPIGADGAVCLYTQSGTHLVADITGYLTSAAPQQALTPERLLDTRGGPRPAPGDIVAVPVRAHPAVPDDATAAIINLTGTEAAADGYVTAYPCGQAPPLASNLNLTSGATTANLVITPIGADGAVCLYTQSGTHLVADITGYLTSAAPQQALTPERLLDTRGGPRPAPGDIVAVPVRAHPAVPDDATAAIINLTGTEAAADGYVTAYPCGQAPPLASNLNLTSGATTANLVITPIGADGAVCLYTQSGTHLVADITGYQD